MSAEPLTIQRRIELAEAIIELAAAEARLAGAQAARGSFDAKKRYDKLHSQIDICLSELDWLKAVAATFGQAPGEPK